MVNESILRSFMLPRHHCVYPPLMVATSFFQNLQSTTPASDRIVIALDYSFDNCAWKRPFQVHSLRDWRKQKMCSPLGVLRGILISCETRQKSSEDSLTFDKRDQDS